MATLIVGLVGMATALIAWRTGYAAGNMDGTDGLHKPFPWSAERRTAE